MLRFECHSSFLHCLQAECAHTAQPWCPLRSARMRVMQKRNPRTVFTLLVALHRYLGKNLSKLHSVEVQFCKVSNLTDRTPPLLRNFDLRCAYIFLSFFWQITNHRIMQCLQYQVFALVHLFELVVFVFGFWYSLVLVGFLWWEIRFARRRWVFVC